MFSLEVNSLEKSFGATTVFEHISFIHDSDKGVLGIAGPNGSGKSTLLKCVAGLLRPSGGIINWRRNGESVDFDELKNYLGFAAPYINLYEELTIIENLQFLARLRNLDPVRTELPDLLEQLEISHVADQPFGKLSTGQQQRARIASALAHKPGIVMLDEPGSNLDERGHSVVGDLVDSFRTRSVPVILASNNLLELDLCDRIFSVDTEKFLREE